MNRYFLSALMLAVMGMAGCGKPPAPTVYPDDKTYSNSLDEHNVMGKPTPDPEAKSRRELNLAVQKMFDELYDEKLQRVRLMCSGVKELNRPDLVKECADLKKELISKKKEAHDTFEANP